jgi:glycosyltransferase involved in cell wall biosynthesis
MNTPDEQSIKVIMLGPALDVRGGVASVEQLILAHAPRGVHIRHIGTMRDGGMLRKLVVFLTAIARLNFLLLTRRVDLIHIHFASRASTWRKSLLALVARWFGKPYILHAHGAEFHEFFPKQPRLLQRWIVSMLRKSRALIAVSERWKQFYLNISGLPSEHIVVLPNPINVPERCPSRRDRRTVTLLFLGRMENRKGPIRAVRAFHALPDRLRQRAHLVLAGDGDVESVRREVSALGLEQQVTVLDWVNTEQRNTLLADADVFVLPSLNEGLPMSVLEAMSWGIPAVTSPVGGIPEVVQDGFNGFLVPPEDIPALANALQRLIEDEPLRLQMGASARASVEHLDIRRYWEKLEGIYRAVLSEGKP